MKDLATAIRRIAAETTAGSKKEEEAILLACFVFNVCPKTLRYFINEERNAALVEAELNANGG